MAVDAERGGRGIVKLNGAQGCELEPDVPIGGVPQLIVQPAGSQPRVPAKNRRRGGNEILDQQSLEQECGLQFA